MITIKCNIDVPELDALPIEDRKAIVRTIMKSPEYKALLEKTVRRRFLYLAVFFVLILCIKCPVETPWREGLAIGLGIFIFGFPVALQIQLPLHRSFLQARAKDLALNR